MPSYLQKGPTLSLPANKTTQTNVTFGIGNGSDVNFTVIPPTGFSSVYVSTIYRTDWQGTQALSASPRTNYFLKSEGNTEAVATPPAEATLSTGISDPRGTTAAIRLTPKTLGTTIYVYRDVIGLGVYGLGSLGVYIRADVGKTVEVKVSNYATNTEVAHGTCYGSGGWDFYKFSFTTTDGAGLCRVVLSMLNSSAFDMFAFNISNSLVIGSYIPTTTTPVTVTDYTVSGLTYTLAETPVTGAILSYTGYSYTAAYATFDIPTCGSISISPSGLTSGKLQITASVDGANFNPDVILPIDEATGVLAASSDLPNGFYTLNVKPFKSIRFTQTDVTDTVTISTALGR